MFIFFLVCQLRGKIGIEAVQTCKAGKGDWFEGDKLHHR
ncbi:MAG: hypothetical protein ETSY1_26710 [Candidatus Entotheonella factor]|uniref:Uncharacterized protein n=1 Tax=Entotheonella factor TaxID=1429438 RepID=W4LET7_ENTF1|nr:MAG: hypothetical protein ETSY1_26710 [Candidatus Entotheonella factor]